MKRSGAAVAAVLGLTVVSAAQAYILPQGSILRRMADGRDDLQLTGLRVEGSATFIGSGAKEAAAGVGLPADRTELPLDVSLSVRLPGKCRMDFSTPEGGKGALVLNAGRKRVEGTDVAPLSVALEEVCALLAVRSSSEHEARGAIEKHLRARGVEPKQTSLGRFGGKVTYVLGDPAEKSPQLWVYKEGFLPARIRYADPQGTAWDVRFLDYASAATGEWFPRTLEVSRAEELVLRFTSLKGDAKSAVSDKLFQ